MIPISSITIIASGTVARIERRCDSVLSVRSGLGSRRSSTPSALRSGRGGAPAVRPSADTGDAERQRRAVGPGHQNPLAGAQGAVELQYAGRTGRGSALPSPRSRGPAHPLRPARSTSGGGWSRGTAASPPRPRRPRRPRRAAAAPDMPVRPIRPESRSSGRAPGGYSSTHSSGPDARRAAPLAIGIDTESELATFLAGVRGATRGDNRRVGRRNAISATTSRPGPSA